MRTITQTTTLCALIMSIATIGRCVAQALPDTTFLSAADIEYVIERHDTITSPNVASYDDLYDTTNGTLTFRGSSRRDMPQTGRLVCHPTTIETEWVFTTAYDSRQTSTGVWGGGSGWTGQPLYIEWPDSLVALQRETSPSLTADFSAREIIVGSLSGDVYFIDFETGKASRKAYNTGNPIKGTVSLDPRLNGNLYIGQGIPATEPIGADVFNLFDHRRVSFFGRDAKSWRRWSAYDASAVVVDNFVMRPSENGTLYKFTADEQDATLHTAMRYRRRGMSAPGMEASPAVWRNYIYVTDNSGMVMCVNINTMKPVWTFRNGDDTDASPMLVVEDDGPMLYVGSELDKQGSNGFCYLTKLNALTGEKVWQNRIACHKFEYAEKLREGGMFSTPLVGRGNAKGLIFTNICGMGDHKGTFVALDTQSGKVVYTTKLDYYSWSSPVALLTDDDAMYVFTGDVIGNIYLIDAQSGKIIFKQRVAWNFESSPVVVDDCVVVGSRGNKIYKFKIM